MLLPSLQNPTNMKRLIACTDGTWDKPGDLENGKSIDSNVCLIYQAIAKESGDGTKQVKVYDTGVGSSYGWRDKILGGTMGKGLDQKIMDMYAFLMLNYQPEDELYFFGFSRGAYTARSLAGFIRNCGILKPQHLNLLEKAFSLYRDRNAFTAPDSDLMVSFRSNYSIEDITPIHFIGVWDTVGSLGLPLTFLRMYNMEKYKFHDETLSSTVRNAFHALSVDDRRKLFQPTLWEASKKKSSAKVPTQKIEQRWFPGVHCNIGGGYADRGLSDQALMWMIEKAKDAGLAFDPEKLATIHPKVMGTLRNSYTAAFWFWHKIWRGIRANDKVNEEFDPSVKLRLEKDPSYRPANLKKFFPHFY
jgi:uncharacterized protein (DUF2235 family)